MRSLRYVTSPGEVKIAGSYRRASSADMYGTRLIEHLVHQVDDNVDKSSTAEGSRGIFSQLVCVVCLLFRTSWCQLQYTYSLKTIMNKSPNCKRFKEIVETKKVKEIKKYWVKKKMSTSKLCHKLLIQWRISCHHHHLNENNSWFPCKKLVSPVITC